MGFRWDVFPGRRAVTGCSGIRVKAPSILMTRRWLQSRVACSQSHPHPEYLPPWIVPQVPCRISGSCTKRVRGDARSSPGSASGDSSCCRGLFWCCSLQRQTDNPPAERLAEPELPSTQAQLGNVRMQGAELMLQLELTPILWVYFISSSLTLA